MALGLFLVYGSGLLLPLAVLGGAFLYARLQGDDPLTVATGATAYLAIMIVASALVIAIGAGQVLTAIFGDLNDGFTYGAEGALSNPFGAPGSRSAADRQDADLSGGLGLVLVGVALATLHVWLRSRLDGLARIDTVVERAVEFLATLGFGLVMLVFAAWGVSTAVERFDYGEDAGAPGEALAYAITFAGVWLVYGARVLIALTPSSEPDAAESDA